MVERRPCKGCGAIPFKPYFVSMPKAKDGTSTGDVWCDDCILDGKSDLDEPLVEYVRSLHRDKLSTGV